MLTAYGGRGLHIDEIPIEEIMLSLHHVFTIDEAKRILAEAERERPDVRWYIVGRGPWGVRGEPLEDDKATSTLKS